MTRIYLTGDKELEATLKNLADKEAYKIARSALGAGLSKMAAAIRRAAPVGPTGNLKANIGKRLEKGKRGGKIMAKAGVNVGKTKKTEKAAGKSGRDRAPHAHLVALGTQRRARQAIGGRFAGIRNPTDQQLSTGTMPANPFVKQAVQSSKSSVTEAMQKRAAKALAKALQKIK